MVLMEQWKEEWAINTNSYNNIIATINMIYNNINHELMNLCHRNGY